MEHRSNNSAGVYKNSLAKVTTEVLIFQKNLQSSLVVISARHFLDKTYKKNNQFSSSFNVLLNENTSSSMKALPSINPSVEYSSFLWITTI